MTPVIRLMANDRLQVKQFLNPPAIARFDHGLNCDAGVAGRERIIERVLIAAFIDLFAGDIVFERVQFTLTPQIQMIAWPRLADRITDRIKVNADKAGAI